MFPRMGKILFSLDKLDPALFVQGRMVAGGDTLSRCR
jgi:hypothetical protein